MRTFERTHPWLTFRFDVRRAPYTLWMDLGAIQSKCEHVARSLLPPDVASSLERFYLAKGVAATTAIEGNTLSEEQVRARVRRARSLPTSLAYQGREVDNVIAATRATAKRLLEARDCRLTPDDIKRFNALVLRGLPLDEDVVPGQISRHPVGVARYRGAPRKDCAHLLERLCHWINDEIVPPNDDQRVAFGVLAAVLAHLYVAWIHPFGDGNGRTARLVEFQILVGAGVPTIAAHLLSNHYNRTRPEYYRLLAASSKSSSGPLEFVHYAVTGLRDGLDQQIVRIRRHLRLMAWKDHVYEQFRQESGQAAMRQRKLALALGRYSRKTFAFSELLTITPEVAAEYADKTRKTLTRDVNALIKRKLVVLRGRGVRARIEILESLLPKRRSDEA